MSNETMSAREAAEYLGLSYKHTRDLARTEQIKHHRGGTEKMPVYRFKKEWLDEFLAKRLGPIVEAKHAEEKQG